MAHPLPWTLGEAVARVGGRLLGADGGFCGVGIDSRQDLTGRLFVALPGERHDGHDFAASAGEQGATALMVERELAIDLPQWQVEDTRLALGQLASAHRDRFAGRVLVLTGSNGKTTTKEMIAAILGQAGRVRATRGNLNNDIGLPLTLLEAGDEDFLVLEMGANHPGEIAYLTAIARPEVAAITNAGRAHLEGFGSLEGVARAKGEIVAGLGANGTFIFPADSPWAGLWRALAGTRHCLTCGPAGAADLSVDLTAVATRWDAGGLPYWLSGHRTRSGAGPGIGPGGCPQRAQCPGGRGDGLGPGSRPRGHCGGTGRHAANPRPLVSAPAPGGGTSHRRYLQCKSGFGGGVHYRPHVASGPPSAGPGRSGGVGF